MEDNKTKSPKEEDIKSENQEIEEAAPPPPPPVPTEGGGGGGGWGVWGFSPLSVFSDLQKAAEEISRNANAVFGRLRPRHINGEAEEDFLRQENNMLKVSLARERNEHEGVFHTNEGLWRDLAQAKEALKASEDKQKAIEEELRTNKASQQSLVDMNVGLVGENLALKTKNEELVTAHRSLAIQLGEVQTKAQDDKEAHKAKRHKLRHKIKALEGRGPLLTEELRKQIQADYRASDDLNAEILKVYSEGYEDCRE